MIIKNLGLNTSILMYDGTIKNIQDIKTNDLLMGADSKSLSVISNNIKNGELYNIIPVKGDTWTCGINNILTLVGTNAYKNHIIDISLHDYLKTINRLKSAYKDWKLIRSGIEFKECNIPYDSYFIGLWIGDGTFGKVQISNIEPEIINYCEYFAKEISCIFTKKYVEKHNYYSLDFTLYKKTEYNLFKNRI